MKDLLLKLEDQRNDCRTFRKEPGGHEGAYNLST